MEQRTPLPADLLTSQRDICHRRQPVTASETHLAITRLKYGTSAGPGDITYSTLQRFHKAATHLLSHLFTACLKYAVHPPEWKTANCVVISKSGKTTCSDPKSYCLISPQSCFGKLLESIVEKRLSHAALMCGETHPSQMGAQQENSAMMHSSIQFHPLPPLSAKRKPPTRPPLDRLSSHLISRELSTRSTRQHS